MAAPAEFAQVRELLKEDPGADAFEPLHDRADVLMGTVGEKEVELVACHLARENLQFMLERDLADEIAHTSGHRPHEQRLPILGNPDHVDLEIEFRVRTQAIFWHAPILPHPSLRLKARGFHHPRRGH